MSQKQHRGSGLKDGTTVTIKPKAYMKMKKHVLRFASNVKDAAEFREVMGMLMGRLVDGKNPDIKDVIIEDAVPVNHGGAVEVAFAPEDYVNFSILDSQFADKGLFNVGWYHSHPNLSCFYSAVDIRNQLGFQAANPAAIGLVFDHVRFKDPDDLGFEAYRLDDPAQGPMSDYHEVDWNVEAPEDFSFYQDAIKSLIDAYHRGEPAILELSEVPDVFGDLTIPGRNAMMAKEPELNFAAISDKLTKSISDFSTAFFQPLIKYINEWGLAMSKGLIDKNIEMLEVVVDLKTKISKAIGGLQSWFKFQINDKLRDIDISLDDQMENLGKERTELLGKIDGLDGLISGKLGEAFTQALGDTLQKITEDMTNTLSKFKTLMESSSSIAEMASSQQAMLSQGVADYNQQVETLTQAADGMMSNLNTTITTAFGGLTKDLEGLEEQQKDLLDSVKELKNIAGKL